MTPEELAKLDREVALAEGGIITASDGYGDFVQFPDGRMVQLCLFRPASDGAEAMRLLEKYGLSLVHDQTAPGWFCCRQGEPGQGRGPTPAIAICRAVVALKGKE